jgi:hypothetical protein
VFIYKSTIAIFNGTGNNGRTYTKHIIAVISKPPPPFSPMTNRAPSSPSKKVRLRSEYDSSFEQSIPVAATVVTSEMDDQVHGETSNPDPIVLIRCCDVLHVHTSLTDCNFDLTKLTIKESVDHFNSHINDARNQFGTRRKGRADEKAFSLIQDTKRSVINASPFKYFYQEEFGEEITLRVAEPPKFVVADDGKEF